MTQNIQRFTVVDPRAMDGNPYEVGARGIAQLRGILRIAELSLPAVELMARNAELERQMVDGDEPDAISWPASPQGRKFERIKLDLARMSTELSVLERAAGYDPKNPPRA
jgi:hypothetical protein